MSSARCPSPTSEELRNQAVSEARDLDQTSQDFLEREFEIYELLREQMPELLDRFHVDEVPGVDHFFTGALKLARQDEQDSNHRFACPPQHWPSRAPST